MHLSANLPISSVNCPEKFHVTLKILGFQSYDNPIEDLNVTEISNIGHDIITTTALLRH